MFQKYENKVEDIIKAQNGDNKALESLIKQNQGLLWSIVKRFTGRGFETEDLYQIASLGFIKCIKKFDTNFDVRLSTYTWRNKKVYSRRWTNKSKQSFKRIK